MAHKKSTIHDIARELQVSAGTVSRALNDNPRISEETRKAVRDMAVQLDYEHNHIAAALRSGRTYILGVIVPTANRTFFSSVINGIEVVAKEAGYSIIICQSNDDYRDEVAIIDTLLRLRVDGIIASIGRETKQYDHFRKVREKKVPLVLFDRVSETLEASTVVIDDRLGAYWATEHLVNQGYRRIAHLAGPQHINIYKYRCRGYCDALEAKGLPVVEPYIKTGVLGVAEGRMMMSELLALPEPPDAVFSASDYSAVGAMQVLKERGIRIPQDVGLVGFANEPFDDLVEPGLTSVDQLSVRMGEFAAGVFLEEIQKGNTVFIPRKTVLTPNLVVRGSSKRV